MLLTYKDNKTGGDATEVDALMEKEKIMTLKIIKYVLASAFSG